MHLTINLLLSSIKFIIKTFSFWDSINHLGVKVGSNKLNLNFIIWNKKETFRTRNELEL